MRSVGSRRVVEGIDDQGAIDGDGTALVVEEIEPAPASSPRSLPRHRLHRVSPHDHHLLGNFVRRFRPEPGFGQRHFGRQRLTPRHEQQQGWGHGGQSRDGKPRDFGRSRSAHRGKLLFTERERFRPAAAEWKHLGTVAAEDPAGVVLAGRAGRSGRADSAVAP